VPEPGGSGGVVVLGLAPSLMISVETRSDGGREAHLHPGGQGFWVARMAARLGVPVTLVAPLAGEPGVALRALIESEGVTVRAHHSRDPCGVWISEGHEGESATVYDQPPPSLSRHDGDALLDLLLAEALGAAVTVLTGDPRGDMVDPASFRRLANDLHALAGTVVGDLAGSALDAALDGGLDVLKVSHEELIAAGLAEDGSHDALVAAIDLLRERGADAVLVSRAAEPALAHTGERPVALHAPAFEVLNHRGAGDSMTGALAAALSRGAPMEDAMRRAVAAAAMNVRRRGLGTGSRDTIERLAPRVALEPLGGPPAPQSGGPRPGSRAPIRPPASRPA
jgi:1-phosphofructokinase